MKNDSVNSEGVVEAVLDLELRRLTRLTADFLFLQGHSFRTGEKKAKADPAKALRVLLDLERQVSICEDILGIVPPGVRA